MSVPIPVPPPAPPPPSPAPISIREALYLAALACRYVLYHSPTRESFPLDRMVSVLNTVWGCSLLIQLAEERATRAAEDEAYES